MSYPSLSLGRRTRSSRRSRSSLACSYALRRGKLGLAAGRQPYRLDRGGVHRRARLEWRALEQLAARLGLGPREADYERDIRWVLRDDREDVLRDLVAAGDAAEDVDEDAFHLLVREHDLERGLH